MKTLRIATASLAVILLTGTISYAALICGAVQMRHFGIHDQSFRLAKHWATLPHTSPHPGAVVVQSRRGHDSAGHPGGHVSRIVEMRGNCRAVVSDSRGTYIRDICSRLIAYVDPNGNRSVARAEPERRQFSARSHHRRYARVRTSTRMASFTPIDRLSIH